MERDLIGEKCPLNMQNIEIFIQKNFIKKFLIYWGHYHNEMKWGEKDFLKRIDDYKELFHVQERPEGQREKPDYYRYYSTQRPVDIGTFPKPPDNAPVESINFDERRMVEGGTIRAWGELAYLKPLIKKHVDDYELRPAPGNPGRERACPSTIAPRSPQIGAAPP